MTSAPRTPFRGDSAGVTLIELMAVLVVIALGVMTLVAAQMRSSNDIYATGRSTRALALANMRMEDVRAIGFDLAVADSDTTDSFILVTQLDSLSPDLKRVRVFASWTENGSPRQLRLDNLLSDR